MWILIDYGFDLETSSQSSLKDICTYQNISGNDLWVVTNRLHKEHLLEIERLRGSMCEKASRKCPFKAQRHLLAEVLCFLLWNLICLDTSLPVGCHSVWIPACNVRFLLPYWKKTLMLTYTCILCNHSKEKWAKCRCQKHGRIRLRVARF